MYTDRVLTCRDCNAEFTFTAAEQQFFDERGLRHPPRRCRTCRKARKAAEGDGGEAGQAHEASAGDASRPARPRRELRQMYAATCAECGARTQVPFEPDPGRAAFCSDCFRRRREART